MNNHYEAGRQAALEKLGGDLIPPARLRFKRYQAQQLGAPQPAGAGAVLPFTPKAKPAIPKLDGRTDEDMLRMSLHQQAQKQRGLENALRTARGKSVVTSDRMDQLRTARSPKKPPTIISEEMVSYEDLPPLVQAAVRKQDALQSIRQQPVVPLDEARKLRQATADYTEASKDFFSPFDPFK